jgi:hypothetical protein
MSTASDKRNSVCVGMHNLECGYTFRSGNGVTLPIFIATNIIAGKIERCQHPSPTARKPGIAKFCFSENPLPGCVIASVAKLPMLSDIAGCYRMAG